jgi:restriction modification system DNA specificity domain protein
MNIPQGYKQTELGIIPEDWEVKPIGECLSIGNGCDYKDKPFGNIPVYGTGGVITYINDYLYDGQTICIGRKGTINKPLYYEGKIWTVDTLYYTYNFIDVDVKYIYYLLLTIDWMSLNEATGVPSLTSDRIRHILLALPPVAEQRAIAEALGDIDGLIAALDKKIAKKRLIKQGAMQQLLTGKKRLPGFSDPWVEKKFSDLYRYASEGGTPDTNNMRFYANGDVPFVKIEDTETKYIESCNSFITSEGINNSSAWIVPVNSIIYTNGATIGNVSINKIPVATKQGILGIIPSSIINLEFMYYLLLSQNFKREVDSRQAKGTFATIILKSLDEIPIYLPLNQMEQIAIATILSDMDKEIDDLEAQRDKYRLLKSGMMQKLLTGQIRLKIK